MSKLPYEHRLNQHKSTRIDEQKLKKANKKKLRNKLDDKSFVIPTMKVDMNRGVLSICMLRAATFEVWRVLFIRQKLTKSMNEQILYIVLMYPI